MLKNEWKRLFNNKILLISSIVILFIPILYGAFFLKSVWDPYGKTGDLPVAVVNHDESVNYQGKTLDVGNELVNNLKENKDLDWNFVSADEAEKGLDNGKYYMVVTIPKNFSKNASTVLDENPKKMNLTYKINPSQNYIGEVVTEQGANQLKNEVATSVTKEYAKSVFAQIKEVGSGMSEASDGAKKLNDGSVKLADGNQTITENLNKLAESTLTFKDGAESANNGAGKLKNGASQINVAVGQAIGGASQLTDGANKLSNGQATFSSKLNQYTDGVSKSSNGAEKLYPAMTQLNGGINQLAGQLPALSGGVSQLANGQKDLNSGIAKLSAGLSQASKQVEASLKEGNSKEAQDNIKALENGISQMEAGISELNATINATGTGDNNVLSKQLKELQAGLEQLKASNNTSYNSAIEEGVNQAIKQAGIDPNSAEASKIIAVAKQGAKAGANQVNNVQNQNIEEALTKINQSLPAITKLSQGVAQLNAGATPVKDGVYSLTNKTKSSLASMQTLADGLNQLQTGAMAAQNGSSKLVNGTSQLQANVPSLTNGVNKLSDGSQQITSGMGSLNGGLKTLAGNNGALNGASADLSSGANALSGGLNQLSAKLPTLHEGTNALSTGLGSLEGGVSALATGAGQISDGSQQLADGSKALGTGLSQVNDGSKELSEKLADGAKQVNDAKATNRTYDMFATPTKLSEKKISEVPNYGHGLAPYVLSLGLYVGALVFNFIFPIRRPSMTPSSGLAWWFSKFSIGFMAAILQAVILDGIMLMLGLGVDSLPEFFMISILTSLTYMFLVMFLAMTFGNPGRFIAMVLLVLQLGGAGGTFPMPLTNSFFNFIHPFLPMSYSVYGFRQAISSGLGNSVYVHSAITLFIIFIVFNILLIGTMYLRKNRRFKVDNESLIEQEA